MVVAAFFATSFLMFAPGGYVAASMNEDGIITHQAEGPANLDSGELIDLDTVFHIASLSKQITAAGVAMAILDGHVDLADPLSKHIPEADHYGEDLTVAHLMYFTSGLTEPYSIDRPGGYAWTTHFYYSVPELIETSLAVPELEFEPGTEWRYNNINFMLLAEIVARAYDKPFSAVIEEKIFTPLGMEASLVNDDITRAIPHRANGIVARTPETVGALRETDVLVHEEGGPIQIRRNAAHYGGSGVMTSMNDWAKWQAEALDQKVLGEAFWKLMVRTQDFHHSKNNDAFGLVHGNIDGVPVLWFAGSDIDASSQTYIASQDGVASTCFSNQPGFDCREQARRLLIDALSD